MNTKVSDARKKLFDLRKKYSAVNLQKYENTVVSSNESLIDSSYSKSVSKPVIKKESVVLNKEYELSPRSSLKSDSGGRRKYSFNETVPSEPRVIGDPKTVSKQNSRSDISSKSCTAIIPDVEVKDSSKNIKRYSSVSNISSIRSCTSLKNDDQSEIEEILSDDVSTSANDPFANVHLVSDDILEEIDSSVGSHSSIKEDLHTGRLSAVQSVKSLQLSSPLEPPKLEYDYESDFELSDHESNTFNSDSESDINGDNNDLADLINNSLQDFVDVIEEQEESNKTVINEKPTSLQTTKLNQLHKEKVTSNNLKSVPVVDKIEQLKSSSSTSKVKTESCDKTISSSAKASENKFIELVSVQYETDDIIKTEFHDSGTKDLKDDIKLSEAPEIINSEVFREFSPSNKQLNKNYPFSKTKSRCRIEKQKNDVGISVKLSTVKTVGVQTNDSITLQNKFDEINSKPALRERWYINTNVKGSNYRPVVKSSKLLKSSYNSESSNYNPLLFTAQDQLPLDRVLDEILRNQIAMTKHFIDCHHNLYIQCCKTVKSINKDYKKRQTPLFIS